MKKGSGDLPYRDEYHGEYEVLAQQRHHQTGGRNDLYHQQEEHVETNEDRDWKCHLEESGVKLNFLSAPRSDSRSRREGFAILKETATANVRVSAFQEDVARNMWESTNEFTGEWLKIQVMWNLKCIILPPTSNRWIHCDKFPFERLDWGIITFPTSRVITLRIKRWNMIFFMRKVSQVIKILLDSLLERNCFVLVASSSQEEIEFANCTTALTATNAFNQSLWTSCRCFVFAPSTDKLHFRNKSTEVFAWRRRRSLRRRNPCDLEFCVAFLSANTHTQEIGIHPRDKRNTRYLVRQVLLASSQSKRRRVERARLFAFFDKVCLSLVRSTIVVCCEEDARPSFCVCIFA